MKITESIINNLKESKVVTIDPEIVAKVQAEYNEAKPEIRKQIENEFRNFVRDIRAYYSADEIRQLPETQAYSDAIKDPEDIWCECHEDHDTEFKPDNESYLGVTKHGYICKNCKKYVQIG